MAVWPQWLYHYGVGGIFFLGMLFAAVRTGAIRWQHDGERRLLVAIVLAFLGFMAVHAAWISLAAN